MPQTDPSKKPTAEEERKAQRAIIILYSVMIFLILLPFVVAFFLRS